MSVPFVLLIILFVLMIAVGGKRGAKSFFTLIVNFVTLFIMLGIMTIGVDPLKVTIIGCIIITSITLFYINGFSKKTVSSLLSVIIVVLINIILTFKMATAAKIQGFSWEQAESISAMSAYIQLNFSTIVMCEILIGLLGAIIDVSISISSSMNELFNNNSSITKKALLKSGINIGKDILGTMTNTLLFAYIGGFMTLIIWFYDLHYSALDILNAKVFCAEVFQILSSGIGIILIIPITAMITSKILFFKFPARKAHLKAKT
jgi:uncharacterized membrane protein